MSEAAVPPPSTPVRVQGVTVDEQGRCHHWRSVLDIVSFRFPCCEGFWACHQCHETVADHPARPWAGSAGDEPAVLCGACGSFLTIATYRARPESCPDCGADFNPRCRLHHPLYFEAPDDEASPESEGGS